MRKILFVLTLSTIVGFNSHTQEIIETFRNTRIVNSHSSEVLKQGLWEYRIEHRFGDLAGSQGGVQTAFGFDNVADIRMAFEYGFAKNWMLGFGRSKGIANPYTSLLDGFVKGRILTQNSDKKVPFSLAVLGSSFYSYMKKSIDPNSLSSFPKRSHRLSYSAQLIATRKINDRLSFAIMPTYTHRNYVNVDDVNGLLSLGSAFNVKLTKSFGVVVEYFYNIHDNNIRKDYKNALGIGVEFITSGHNFHINLTNTRGFGEVQYVALNTSDWTKGQFRLGFSISRDFKIRKK
ncbi:MAG: hypothetical protein ACI9XP_000295 [Lentimonas sp.]|jgi:hypothetical protein